MNVTAGPAPPAPSAEAVAQARAWLAAATRPFAPVPSQAREWAWALKAACHAAWNTAPAQTRVAAQALAELAARDDLDPACRAEVHALALWTQGLAALVEGEMARALDALQAAAQSFEQQGQPLLAAQAGVPQLIALSMLGRHDDAIERAGLLRQRLADGGDGHAASKIDLNRGSMLLRLDRYEQAGQSYRQAAVGFARAGDTEHSVMADIGLAATLTWQSQFAAAGHMLARARQRARAHELPVLQGLACGELGQLALQRGDRITALREFEASRSLLAGRAPPQRLIEADRALADAYLGVRLLPEARRLYEEVIAEALALDAPVEAAWARLQLAQTLLLLGDADRADQAIEAARHSFDAHRNPIGLARAQLLRARRVLAQGDADSALALGVAASDALADAQATGWRIEAGLVAAQALAALGRPGEAQTLLDRLSAVAELAGALPQRPWCDMAQAELAEQRGDLPLARRRYGLAARRFEHLRRLLPPGELRIASAMDSERAADGRVRLCDPQDAAALLQHMEEARARSLHDHWRSTAEPGTGARAAAGGTQGEDALRLRLNWLYRQWQQSLVAGPAQAGRAAMLLAQVREAERDWQTGQRRARLNAPDPAHGGGSAPVVDEPSTERPDQDPSDHEAAGPRDELDLAALRSALGPERMLLSYHVDGAQWRACLASERGISRHEGQLPDLAGRLRQLQFQLGAMRQPGASQQRHAPQLLARCQALLRAFHADLITPLEPALRGAGQLVIVPHRGLHALPWAALTGPDGLPLIEHHELVIAPSATTWLRAHGRASAATLPPGAALVVGASAPGLPAIDAEAQAVCEALGPTTRLLQREGASSAAVIASAGSAGTLHLACHASCRADNPDFSALHLSDGLLTAADASALVLRAELVTLSACDTVISRIAPGDEVLGLARAFLLAGAGSVLATLWSVEDGSTAELMVAFYRARRQGLGIAAALRQAQRSLASERPHPFFWAPFVAYGHG